MRHSIRIAGTSALLSTILIATVGGCSQKSAPGPIADSPAIVTIIHPQKKPLRRTVEQPGTVEPDEETQLFARVPGYVRLEHDSNGRIIIDRGRKVKGPVYDTEGKEVKSGDVLAELVVPELVQEAEQKKAMTRQAVAEVTQQEKALAAAEANITAVEAAVAEARALVFRWESESNRIAKLVQSGTIDAQVRDETQNQYRAAAAKFQAAEAAVRKATADRDKSAADVRAAEARVDVAKAAALRADAMVGYAKIRAPYDGIVTARKVSDGAFVQPGGGKDDWLFTVTRLDPVRVVIWVAEADAELIREGAEAKTTVQVLPGARLTGKVVRTSWSLDTISRTLRTEIELPNKEGRLRPGMYVYTQITCDLPERWTLPGTALVKQEDGMACYLAEDGKAVRIPVQIGRADGRSVQIMRRQKPGTPPTWEDWTGNEPVVERAAGVKDGQAVQEGK